MITINCPKCGRPIEVDETRRTSRGKIRVKCNECGAKLSMRPRKGDDPGGVATASTSMPAGREETPPPPSPQAAAEDSGGAEAVDSYAVVIENLAAGKAPAGLNEVLLTLPEFQEHPNKLSDLAHRVPYVISGLTEGQAGAVEAELKKAVALFSAGPEREVLVGPLRAYRTRPGAERDNGGGAPVSAAEVPAADDRFGLGNELSEGELEMPGDPDEEDSVAFQIDEGDGGDEADESLVVGAEGGEAEEAVDSSRLSDAAESDESLVAAEAVGRADSADGESAFGMSIEMEVPMRKNPGRASGDWSDANQSRDGDAPTRMVVTNLPDLDGFRLEPLGLVTHTFCRKGGGEGIEAKKRVHAFGNRYRKGLADLAEQAQALGGNTVLGVEIQLMPTGTADSTIVWIVVQGTAARRTEL